MGCCGSPGSCSTFCNQSFDLQGNKHLHVDPDIVGAGVLAGFFVTAVITCGAIIYGYISDSLPDEYLTDADKIVLEKLRGSFLARVLLPGTSRIWQLVKAFIKRCLCLNSSNKEPKVHLSKAQRIEALTRFLLALSDQQLVTGLAILISTIANSCHINCYEFGVVVGLAWFSSTTHLATLGVLRAYFIRHRIVRNWRIVGMLIMMVLLGFTLVILNGSYNYTVATPLHCAIHGVEFPVDTLALINIVQMAWILIYLITAYMNRILSLYYPAESRIDAPRWAAMQVLFLLTRRKFRDLDITEEDLSRLHGEAESEQYAAFLNRHSIIACNSPERATRLSVRQNFRKWRSSYQLAWDGFARSFGSEIPLLFFGLSYGISQVASARWISAPPLDENAYRWDFGQIVPLLLLSLPILAAGEIYYETHAPRDRHASQYPRQSYFATQDPSPDPWASHNHQLQPHSTSTSPYRNPLIFKVIILLALTYFILSIAAGVLLNVVALAAAFLVMILAVLIAAWLCISFISEIRLWKPLCRRIVEERDSGSLHRPSGPESGLLRPPFVTQGSGVFEIGGKRETGNEETCEERGKEQEASEAALSPFSLDTVEMDHFPLRPDSGRGSAGGGESAQVRAGPG